MSHHAEHHAENEAVIFDGAADGESPQIVSSEVLIAKASEIHEEVALRAYHLFEARGHKHGHDKEDWADAEAELLDPVRIGVTQDDYGVVLEAAFSHDEVRGLLVSVEPWRVMFYGSVSLPAAFERRARHAYASVVLPDRVNPFRPEVSLQKGTLEIHLSKVIQPDEEAAT